MKKPVIISVIVVVIIVAGVAAWLMWGNANNMTNMNAPSSNNSTSTATDMTGSRTAAVTIRDLSYSPANIKIKKGTTVTWTNQDSVGHNVVADDASNAGGLPTDHPVFGKGQTYTLTFTATGTFHYHCSVHTFMEGSVEVVD